MTTNYRSLPNIQFADLPYGRLEKYGIKVETDPVFDDVRHLVGSDGSIEVRRDKDGSCAYRFNSSGGRAPFAALSALAEEFGVEFVSEHDHRYWGFDTEEEWFAALDEMAQADDDKFYSELISYLRNEPNDLELGTHGMEIAKSARELVAADPGLMAPERRNDLLAAVEKFLDERIRSMLGA
jgi:hypothetical protein